MARSLRVQFPGAIYHVTCRRLGDWQSEKAPLFNDDVDRERFLKRLAERVDLFHIRLYLFVLMTNHFHLVFETPQANGSRFMQSLLTAYTVYYNLRHRRHGHLLDGRFKAKCVEGDHYLLALSRYVHLNPVYVGAIKDKSMEERIDTLRRYRWSSYPSYIGQSKVLPFLDSDPVLGEMGKKPSEWPRRYREFVESGLAQSDEDLKAAMRASPHSVGSERFRISIDELYQNLVGRHRRPEDVLFRHQTKPLGAEAVLGILAEVCAVEVEAFRQRRRNSSLRGLAAHCLCRYAGLTQREAAEALGVGTGAAISQQLRRLTVQLSRDRRLWQLARQAEIRLKAAQKGKANF